MLAEVEISIGSDFVNCHAVDERKVQHVEGGVPASRYVTGHHTKLEAKFLKLCVPLRKDDS